MTAPFPSPSKPQGLVPTILILNGNKQFFSARSRSRKEDGRGTKEEAQREREKERESEEEKEESG